ncbi:MAG: glycosyltransferase family 9 protein [bacterium]|nr:glycosyltransferase family 9 protein [bacterium]
MNKERILLVRHDALGDALVTLPAAAALRASFPEAEVAVLAGERGEWAFERAGFQVLPDPGGFSGTVALLRDYGPRVVIVASPGGRIPLAAWAARVPVRIGYARRLWGFAYNRPLFISRRRSGAHEAALALALLRPLGIRVNRIEPPRLEPLPTAVAEIGIFLKNLGIFGKYAVLHPGSGGSATEWPPGHYRELARMLIEKGYGVMVSGVERERIAAEGVVVGLNGPCASLAGLTDLDRLAALIAGAALFVSSGTGPMHLAAALGVPQVALFNRKPTINPARWRPLNPRARIITPPGPEGDLDAIQPRSVLEAAIGLETRPDYRYTEPTPSPSFPRPENRRPTRKGSP